MARVMGQAGHKIIIADLDPTGGLCLTRFSKYVTKYVVLEAKTAAEYEEKLVKIWETEKVRHWTYHFLFDILSYHIICKKK
jgi:hypothetical protein